MHRYIVTETLLSMAVNAAFSAGFAFLIFGGRSEIGLWGPSGLALDFAPQTFVIALMSVLVPTALTRRRMRSGALERSSGASSRLPRNLLVRALLVAVLATLALGGAATLLLATNWPGPLTFAAVLPLKIVYGALVASVVTPLALRAALLDRTVEPT
ncbi:MAG TPA: hypothetical protein VMG08_14475 [Allosphingosinicella sp.]|nr:hypothetical protein [Allosphingosinicella sp.]